MKCFLYCALVWLACAASAAAGDCCARCGCQSCCEKVCHVVPTEKKVTKPEYDCECEDFCVPGKSKRCVNCDECGHRKVTYTPTCAEVRTRAKLIKHEKTEKVASYKWVVEDLCPTCAEHCKDGCAHACDEPCPPAPFSWRRFLLLDCLECCCRE